MPTQRNAIQNTRAWPCPSTVQQYNTNRPTTQLWPACQPDMHHSIVPATAFLPATACLLCIITPCLLQPACRASFHHACVACSTFCGPETHEPRPQARSGLNPRRVQAQTPGQARPKPQEGPGPNPRPGQASTTGGSRPKPQARPGLNHRRVQAQTPGQARTKPQEGPGPNPRPGQA